MSNNILILTPFYPPNVGGAETFTEQLVKEASKWNQVQVLTFQPFQKKLRSEKYEEWFSKRGSLKILRMNWLLKPTKAWRGFNVMIALGVFVKVFLVSMLKFVRHDKNYIIHSQGLICGLAGVILNRIFKCKHYITLLALYNFHKRGHWFWEASKFILDRCDLIFVEGEGGFKDIKCMRLDPEKIKIFNHWVDQDLFKPPAERVQENINVLFIGRPIPEKGRQIIEYAERTLDRKDLKFHYVEDVPYKDLPSYYKMAHVVCVPSLYDEGFSRVVAESASSGCILITSDKGSLPEMVKEFGIICSPPYRETFKSAISLVHTFIAQGILSREVALRNFSKKNAEVFLNSYV